MNYLKPILRLFLGVNLIGVLLHNTELTSLSVIILSIYFLSKAIVSEQVIIQNQLRDLKEHK